MKLFKFLHRTKKTFKNTTSDGATKNVKDIKFWGNPDMFKLICKAWSEEEGWMKSTKAMEIKGVGCLVQVTTQQGDNVSEAIELIPNTRIKETYAEDGRGDVIAREIVKIF